MATRDSHNADCLLLDLRMPRMSGIDLLKSLQPGRVHGPVLMLSAYHGTPDIVLAMQLGAAR